MKTTHEVTEMPRNATIGDRIKWVRRAWKWSQAELAQALRVDQASISFWERDRIKPSGSALLGLSSLFRSSVEGLRDGTGFNLPEAPASVPAAADSAQVPRTVCLPQGGAGKVMLVDLADGSLQDRDLAEAVMGLVQGAQGRRKAWVVLA